MKIYYDYQICCFQKYGGISRYFYDLICYIKKQDLANADMRCIFSQNVYFEDFFNKEAIHKYPPAMSRIISLVNKLYVLFFVSRDFDIIHPTYYETYILKKKNKKTKLVITVYDMIHEEFSDMFSPFDHTSQKKKKMIQNADHIIAISENTKKDILKHYPDISPDRISVIYIGCSFKPNNKIDLSERFPQKYILFVGRREGYKNYKRFWQAVRPLLIEDNKLHLVCIGGEKFTIEERKSMGNLQNRVMQMDANDDYLSYAYMNAECFVFPSLYEGFGIPTLEAFACGCPVVLSDTSSMPEVAGDAGVYFDPEDEQDMRKKIAYVLNNKVEQKRLVEKGYQQLKKFQWDKIANQIVNCYQIILDD